MTEQADNPGAGMAASAIERALRAAHDSGVGRAELDAIVERAIVRDDDRIRLRKLVADLTGDTGRALEPATSTAPVRLLFTPAEQVLGALLLAGADGPDVSKTVLERVRSEGLTGSMFARERDRQVFTAIERAVDQGLAATFLIVEAELQRMGADVPAGGDLYVRELAKSAPSTSNAASHARLVVAEHRRQEQEQAALRLLEAVRAGGDVAPQLRDHVVQTLEPALDIRVRERLVPGGAFILDEPATATAVWGDGDEIAWASGEGLMVAGPQGVGKTTLMQQLALCRIGLRHELIGFPVTRDDRPVLYIAADRPRQVQRSLARMVDPGDRALLDERLVVHRGPTSPLITSDQDALLRLAEQTGAGTVFVDSLKDVAAKLSEDESGGRINLAFQTLIAAGVELVVGHHQRKGSTDNKTPKKLEDVYGSTWITSGLGSVLLLWGEPGDILVELRHLKQPNEEIGPLNLQHDHARGITTRVKQLEVIDIVYRGSIEGVTATQAAEVIYQKETPTRNEVEKTRRSLERLVDNGSIVKQPGSRGNDAPRYVHHVVATTPGNGAS